MVELALRGDMAGEDVIDEAEAVPPGAPADDDGFARFYSGGFERAARLAFLLTGDSDGSEDIAQEALCRIQPRFASLDHPWAYLRTVVVNLCKRHGIEQARQRSARARIGLPRVETPRAHELGDVIDALPRRQRAVVVLRYYEDLTEAEIAAVLSCRPGTVKSLATRALNRLRKELET
jgi:RNA polymerase sigma factor (sigma-70 family)